MKVTSFNVLADAYLKNGDYSRVEPELLRPGARNRSLVRLIQNLDSDILGLQEVEQPLVDELVDTSKWQAFYTQKTSKPDGCLTLVKNEIPIDNQAGYAYEDGSGHVYQITQIGKIAIANTHIKWAPADAPSHVGLGQMSELLRRLGDRPAVILGDCNDRPGGPIRQLLAKSGFTDANESLMTAIVDGELAALDLTSTRDVKATSAGEHLNPRTIPNHNCPSDHIPISIII